MQKKKDESAYRSCVSWWSTSLFEDVSFFSCTFFLAQELRERMSSFLFRFYFFPLCFPAIFLFFSSFFFTSFYDGINEKRSTTTTRERNFVSETVSVLESLDVISLDSMSSYPVLVTKVFLSFFKWNPVWKWSRLRFGNEWLSPRDLGSWGENAFRNNC